MTCLTKPKEERTRLSIVFHCHPLGFVPCISHQISIIYRTLGGDYMWMVGKHNLN